MGFWENCICNPTEKGGYKYVQWIGSVFGDCIYTPLEKFSYYSGVISIIFYFVAFYPQIYENYKRKSTDGLSLVLIIIWFFGDFANYIGTILTEQYPIQKVVGIYFALMEVLIMGQYFYYKFIYKGPNVIEEEEEEDQEPNEYDQLIVKTEGGESQDDKDRQVSSLQHTYETFSDIQKSPIHPPLDPVEAIDATPKANINNIASPVDVTEPTATNTNTNTTTDTTSTTNNNGAGSLSSSVISKSSKRSFLENENIEVISEPKPEPQEVSKPETKYETFDEISQKQQEAQAQSQAEEKNHQVHNEEVPVYNITSNINTDTNAQSFSASISSSLSKANMRNTKNESQESLTNQEEDNDGEDSKNSTEEIYESSSKEASSLSIDAKDGEEDDDDEDDDDDNENEGEGEDEGEGSLNRSESSLNRRRKKKGKKGKKKKGRKPKRGKGLSTVIQTIALLSLFIIQVQARAFNWSEGYNSRRLLETRDEPIKICDEKPDLSMTQKVLGSFMAWGSGLLYFCCRIPQILENKRNRSVEGLSIFLFLCTILGNLFYGLSIMIRFPPIDEKFFAGTLPYLIGSVGTFIFDIIIIYQFNVYKYSSSSEPANKNL
jgi:uncharacterized protein with PQ loop repeat